MNIFGVSSTILYPLFVYVLFFSGRILVKSNDSFGGSNPSFGSGTKTGVDISLKAKEATGQFNYEKSGQIVTYTAKDNYAFKSVKTGKKGETVVWSTTNASEYANKVILDGKGKKKKKVTIYFPNNTTKVFNRSGKGKPWKEVIQQSNQTNGQQASGTLASGTSQPVSGSSQSANEGTHGGGGSHGTTGGGEGTRGGGASLSQGNEGSPPVATPPANLSGSSTPDSNEAKKSTNPPEGDGSSATPPASSNGGRTSSGTGTDQSSDGSGATHTSGEGGDGNGGGTTPPANEGNDNDSSAEGDGSSATNPPSSGGKGTQGRDPATSTNDLMQQFEKLVGDELQPENYPNDFKFFKANPNDANNPVELTKSEYKVKKFAEEHLYVFYDLNCTLIKCGNNVVWQYGSTTSDPTKTASSTDGSTIPDGTNSSSTTPDTTKSDTSQSNTKYPKGMNAEPDLMFIYFDDHTKVYSKKSEVWNSSGKVEKDLSKLKVIADSKKQGS